MPRADEGINAPGLLLCEGRDDFAFFLAMCSFLRISGRISGETIWIERLGGRGELHDLLNGLPIRDSRKRLRAIGIVSDADGPDDGAESFRRIRDDLRNTGYTAPAQALEIASGPWGGGSSLSVGVYIMPDNQMTGALEDLCLAAISEDPSLRCVDDYLNCVSVAGSISWRTQDRSKARLNAWLASRRDPTLRLGQAVAAGVLGADHRAFGPIRQFLRDLAAAANVSESSGA